MSTKTRIETLRVLIDGHRTLQGSLRLSAITGELARVNQASRLGNHNGWLLAVLHSTRVLDTSLNEILTAKGWLGAGHSLGSYLKDLEANRIIHHSEKVSWQVSIVRKRNKYMHTAGLMPNMSEADMILSEMQACLTAIIGRT